MTLQHTSPNVAPRANGSNPAASANGQARNGQAQSMLPPVDVVEDEGGITLYADLPGVARDKLDLQVESDRLTIEGEVSLPFPEGLRSTYAEVKRPRYRRVFTLSKELDAEQVSAEFNNGLLKLRIPKAAHAQPRRIAINAA